MADKLGELYHGFLDFSYTCVDRIYVKGYEPLLQSCSGFRYWSEQIRPDEPVDQNWIRGLVRRFHNNVKKFAQEHDVPVVEAKKGQRKHLISDEYREKFTGDEGVYLIIKGFEQTRTFVSEQPRSPNKSKHRNLSRRNAFVIHYSFYILDRLWGPICIVICSHPPFNSKVLLNGHYFIERRAVALGLRLERQTNAFVACDTPDTLQELANELQEADIRRVADRWTYRVLPVLSYKERRDSRFKYQWSIAQMEVCHNLVFGSSYPLAELFQRHIDLNRRILSPKSIATTFGKKNPCRPEKCRVSVYQSWHSMTVLKIQHFQSVLKQYDKHRRILRTECVSNNSRRFGVGKLLTNFEKLRTEMTATLRRFHDLQKCVLDSTLNRGELAALAQTSELGESRVPGIRLDNERLMNVLSLLPSLATDPRGFTPAHLRDVYNQTEQPYTSSQTSYDLRKLRAKGILESVNKSRRYRFTARGARLAVLLSKLHQLLISPTLASANAAVVPPASSQPKKRRGPAREPTPTEGLHLLLAKHAGNVSQVAREMGRQSCVVRRWIKRENIDLERYRNPVQHPVVEETYRSLDEVLNRLTSELEVSFAG